MQSDCLANLMKQQNDALAVLVGSGRGNSELTDTRGIGRPVAFKGDELKYAEWKAKLMAYLRISTPQLDELIKWVARADSTVTEEDVDISNPNNKQDVWSSPTLCTPLCCPAPKTTRSESVTRSKRAMTWSRCAS